MLFFEKSYFSINIFGFYVHQLEFIQPAYKFLYFRVIKIAPYHIRFILTVSVSVSVFKIRAIDKLPLAGISSALTNCHNNSTDTGQRITDTENGYGHIVFYVPIIFNVYYSFDFNFPLVNICFVLCFFGFLPFIYPYFDAYFKRASSNFFLPL